MSKPIKKRNLFKSLFITSSVLLIGATAGIPITYYLVPQKNSGGDGGDTPAGEVSLETTYPFLRRSRNKIMNVHGLASKGKYHVSYRFRNPSEGEFYEDTNGGTFEIVNNKEIYYSSTTPESDLMIQLGMRLPFLIRVIDDSTGNAVFTNHYYFFTLYRDYDLETTYSNLSDVNESTWTKIATTTFTDWDEHTYWEYYGFCKLDGTIAAEISPQIKIVDETTKNFSIEIKLGDPDFLCSVTGHFIFWDPGHVEQIIASPQFTIGKWA